MRLVDGDTANEGKVLICINGVWGTLCHSTLTLIDVAVICSTAGYPRGSQDYRLQLELLYNM